MGRAVVHHDHLAWLEGWTEALAHIQIEGVPIGRAWNDQQDHRSRQPQSTDQGLIYAVVAFHLFRSMELPSVVIRAVLNKKLTGRGHTTGSQ